MHWQHWLDLKKVAKLGVVLGCFLYISKPSSRQQSRQDAGSLQSAQQSGKSGQRSDWLTMAQIGTDSR
jgi:hypothetical protein